MSGSWIPTGSSRLDRALDGGLPPSGITLVYGEAETGKTTLAIQFAVNAARTGCKTLFVDSEGVFAPERLSHIASQDFGEVSESIVFVRPSSFDEQGIVIDSIDRYVGKGFGLVVVDTVTSLYRSELTGKKETFKLNRELNRQAATLAQLAKTLHVAVLVLSQVRSALGLGEGDVEPVATRVLKFWSDAVIRLSRTDRLNIIKAAVEKTGGKDADITFYLVVEKGGIRDYAP